ncbi:MAG: hypothetical protein JW874_09940 [Spirochaetales bacterium]|nr:hypothetical protein [Spirochaetales bacterium]
MFLKRRISGFFFIAVLFTIFTGCGLLPLGQDEYADTKYGEGPVPDSPINASPVFTATPEFSWNSQDADGAVYEFQLGTDEDFSGTLIADVSDLTETFYQLTAPLPDFGTYYWRVRATYETDIISEWQSDEFIYINGTLFDDFETNNGTMSTLYNWVRSGDVLPTVQSGSGFDGNYAVVFRSNYSSCTLELDINFETPIMLTFYAKGQNGSLYFEIDSSDSTIEITNSWQPYTVFVPQGQHTIGWRFYSYYNSSAYIDTLYYTELPGFNSENFDITDSDGPLNVTWTLGGNNLPRIQSAVAVAGNAAEFIAPGSSGTDYFETTVILSETQVLSFQAMAESGYGYLRFSIDGTQQFSVSELTDWTAYSYLLTVGSHTLTWAHYRSSSSYTDRAWVDEITLSYINAEMLDDFETNDGTFSTAQSWTRSGSELPFVQSATIHGGNWAAQFGDINNSQTSSFSFTYDFSSDCSLYFAYSVSSEGGYDYLRFYVDGTQVMSDSGTRAWTDYSIAITAGNHTLEWRYSKDGSISSGSDTAWVDDIRIIY